jgi:hypothetical protein
MKNLWVCRYLCIEMDAWIMKRSVHVETVREWKLDCDLSLTVVLSTRSHDTVLSLFLFSSHAILLFSVYFSIFSRFFQFCECCEQGHKSTQISLSFFYSSSRKRSICLFFNKRFVLYFSIENVRFFFDMEHQSTSE